MSGGVKLCPEWWVSLPSCPSCIKKGKKLLRHRTHIRHKNVCEIFWEHADICKFAHPALDIQGGGIQNTLLNFQDVGQLFDFNLHPNLPKLCKSFCTLGGGGCALPNPPFLIAIHASFSHHFYGLYFSSFFQHHFLFFNRCSSLAAFFSIGLSFLLIFSILFFKSSFWSLYHFPSFSCFFIVSHHVSSFFITSIIFMIFLIFHRFP